MTMNLVDANVLVYAVNASAAHHRASHAWLGRALNASDTVLLPTLSTIAFVRLITNPRIVPSPLPVEDAVTLVRQWLDRPQVVVPEPTGHTYRLMAELLSPIGGTGGNLVNDAHLAALAKEHKATVVTFDSDFGRFPGVAWEMPGV